jgi:hypothetical protein
VVARPCRPSRSRFATRYGTVLLAAIQALSISKDQRIKTLLSDLNNAAIFSATGAHWEENSYNWWAMSTDTRSTAIILDAYARLDQNNELAPNIVRWLMVAASSATGKRRRKRPGR